MKNFFMGFLFILLNFNLNGSSIDLIPDFIGYILLAGGLLELEAESQLFPKVRPYSIGMAVYTGIIFALNLFGISSLINDLNYILGIIAMIVLFYISYNIVQGIMDMESFHGTSLNGDKLYSIWKLWVIFSALSFALLIIPGLAVLCVIISAVVAIVFLFTINTSKNLYYDMRDRGI